MTIKLAFKKDNPNLVFDIQEIERVNVAGGIVEYYSGDLIDTSTIPDTRKAFKAQVMAFESEWTEVPVDLGSTGDINNQAKTATPSNSTQTIKPDTGYTGLSKVTINAAPLEAKEATPSTTDQTIQATGTGKIGLSSVTVNAVTAAIDANITAGNIKKDVAILGVTGNVVPLETATVTFEGEGGGFLYNALIGNNNRVAVKGQPYFNRLVLLNAGSMAMLPAVTMGGVDITDTALTITEHNYTDSNIWEFIVNIPEVTGNIVITCMYNALASVDNISQIVYNQ